MADTQQSQAGVDPDVLLKAGALAAAGEGTALEQDGRLLVPSRSAVQPPQPPAGQDQIDTGNQPMAGAHKLSGGMQPADQPAGKQSDNSDTDKPADNPDTGKDAKQPEPSQDGGQDDLMQTADKQAEEAGKTTQEVYKDVIETQLTVEQLRKKAAEAEKTLGEAEQKLQQAEQQLKQEAGSQGKSGGGTSIGQLLKAPLKPPKFSDPGTDGGDQDAKSKAEEIGRKKKLVAEAAEQLKDIQEQARKFNQSEADLNKKLAQLTEEID